jgi:hypothetical protein
LPVRIPCSSSGVPFLFVLFDFPAASGALLFLALIRAPNQLVAARLCGPSKNTVQVSFSLPLGDLLTGIKFFLCVCIQRLCFIAARCSFCLPQGFTAQLPQFVVSRVANLIFFGSRVQEPRSSLPAPDFDAARFLWFVRSPGCSSPKASFFYRALWISIFAAESSFPAQYFRCSRS